MVYIAVFLQLSPMKYIAFLIFRGHLSLNDSGKTPHSSPAQARKGVLAEVIVWKYMYLSSFGIVFNIMLYSTATNY